MTTSCIEIRELFLRGCVIPAHPLALTTECKLDERRQRALTRYYVAAGAGGIAVGVHTTQFAIHDPQIGLYEPVISLAAEELDYADDARPVPLIRVAGITGNTQQAAREAGLARDLGYHAGLLSLANTSHWPMRQLLEHCRTIAEILPVFGFYLQPDVGGRFLPYLFWRQFFDIENVIAIKIAAFNRYHTLDVIRALADSQRLNVALYTGNDDNIIVDLLTSFSFGQQACLSGDSPAQPYRFAGGLLGHWAVWTKKAVELFERCKKGLTHNGAISADLLTLAAQITDSNAAIFDAANNFRGCIAGIHEILKRQGFLESTICLDSDDVLSPGQMNEIERILHCYPEQSDDDFVREHIDEWMR